jgi:hypothetical protein
MQNKYNLSLSMIIHSILELIEIYHQYHILYNLLYRIIIIELK